MNVSQTILGIKSVQKALQVLSVLGLFSDLWPQNALISDGEKFDFIIVGAGTAGCVLANRLTEHNVKVLLIEAGGDPPIASVRPGLFPFLKKTKVDWNYTSDDNGDTERFHKNNVIDLIRGKMLGGSSSMNYMAYTRGNFHDYNRWAEITNDSSWCWSKIIQYFKKSEDMQSKTILESKYRRFHGTNGYMKVSLPHNDIANDYLSAFKEVGNNIVKDTNGHDPLGYTEASLNIANGKRQSAALAFLSTAKERPNLHVLKNALVTKVIINKNNKAIGVQVIVEDKEESKSIKVYAEKEVIVSAGAINSPQLLMLSGIGPKKHLEKHNIKTIADLPVGQALQDHVLVLTIHKMKRLKKEVPVTLNPDKLPNLPLIGYVALNKTQRYPDYQTLHFVLRESQTLLQLCAFYFGYVDDICQELYDAGKGHELLFSFVACLYPKSRGKILLRSSNPLHYPCIYTRYFSNPDDLDNHAKYLQNFLKISESSFFSSIGAKFLVPKACGCTEENLKCYVLCMLTSGYHYSGSVPMGAVLDSRLRVHGVENLRVADASVMPIITGANTFAPTLMIGEKAADMIKKDHGYMTEETKSRC